MAQVAVIIPVHNGALFVGQAVDSVRRQSLADFELIVWDDGSTDGSADVAAESAADDSRIRVMGSASRCGQAAAFNAAARVASSPLLASLDSDDWLAPTALEETVAFLGQRPDVDMVYTNHVMADAAGNTFGLGERCAIPYSPERLLVSFMTFHLRVFRRSAFERAGGIDESYPSATDYDFCLRMSEVGTIAHLPRPLYYYRRHRGAIGTSRRLEQIEQSSRAIRAALERRGLDGELALDVEISADFYLRPKNASRL